jgi:carbon storage regulator
MERGRLCVTRMDKQGVLINGDIEVTVVEVRNGRVKLLIEAPKSVPVVRTELLEVEVA